MATQAQLQVVQQLYVALLGRAADSAGQTFWANAIAAGTTTTAAFAVGLTASTEFQTAYAGLSNSDFIDKVYTNVLGRASDAAGKAFWLNALTAGTVTQANFVPALVASLGAQDQQTINNKVFVAQTYTDTVGAGYNATAGAQVLAGVDNTSASVNTALGQITAGALPGQVAGLGLINAVVAAEAAQTAFETANTPTVDALVATLKATVNNTATSALTAASTYADKLAAIATDTAAAITAKTDTTAVLTAKAADAAAKVTADKAALSTGDKALAAAYDSALAANAALKGAASADVGAAVGGLGGDAGFANALTAVKALGGAFATVATAADVYAAYVAATTTAAQRAQLDTALKGDAYASSASFQATAATDIAKNAAVANVTTTKAAIDGSTTGATYSTDVKDASDAAALVTSAQAADANLIAANAIKAQHDGVVANVTAAEQAVTDFNTTNFNAVTNTGSKLVALDGTAKTGFDTAKETYFYDSGKTGGAPDATKDFAIDKFGAGDSLVIGNGYAYNSGALSTGDNNKLEFFLVQKGNDTLVVLETNAFGSSTTQHTATGDTAAVTSPDAVVITLTGVAASHVAVNNGVISFV